MIEQQVVFNSMHTQDWLSTNDWTAMPVGALLLRNDGIGFGQSFFEKTVTAKKDVANVLELLTATGSGGAGGVEVTSTGYSRQVLTPATASTDMLADVTTFSITQTEIVFGAAVGDAGAQQRIEACVFYVIGADDYHSPLLWMDELATPGVMTGGGRLRISNPTGAFFTLQQG